MASQSLPSVGAHGGLTRYLEEIRQFPMLEPQQEYMLAKSWREHGDRDAAHKLVTSHLRLVARIAMGYRGYGLPIGEVVSEGNVGLMQAVKRFDPDKGFRLATYAMWWIRAAIQEYILRSWSLVKMGTTAAQKKLFFNLRKIKGQLKALDEGDLRPDQVKRIATQLGVTEEDVVSMNRRLAGDSSLNAPVRNDSESGEWQDWLVDDTMDQETALAEFGRGPAAAWHAQQRAEGPERARAPGVRSAAACRGPSDAGRAVGRVRRLPGAHPPDRGARLREGAEGGAEGCRRRRSSGSRSRKLTPPRGLVVVPFSRKSYTNVTPAKAGVRFLVSRVSRGRLSPA